MRTRLPLSTSLALLCLCACPNGFAPSAEPAPEGLEVRGGDTTTTPIPQGAEPDEALGTDFGRVPLLSVSWDANRHGSGVRGAQGHTFSFTHLKPDGTVGSTVQGPTLEGSGADSFTQEVEQPTYAWSRYISIQCKPKAPGVVEADVVTRVLNVSGTHRFKLRCEGITETAYLPGSPATQGSRSGDAFFLGGGRLMRLAPGSASPEPFDFSVQSIQPNFSRGAASADGNIVVAFTQDYIGNLGAKLFWVIDVPGRSITPLLTDGERAQLWSDSLFHLPPWVTDDGRVVTLCDRKGVFRKDRVSGTFEKLPTRATSTGYVWLFWVSPDGRQVIYGEASSSNGVKPDALWLYDTQTGTDTLFSATDGAGKVLPEWQSIVSRLSLSADGQKVLFGQFYYGAAKVFLHDRGTGALREVLVEAQADLRKGRDPNKPGILLVTDPVLSRDGRYVSIGFNLYNNTGYWDGTQGVYVQDLLEGKTYRVNITPSGQPWAGDGWQLTDVLAVPDSGAFVMFGILWSGGVSRERLGPYVALIGRSEWRQVAP